MLFKNEYRTHYCGNLSSSNVDEIVKLSGWMHSIRDHGGLIFIDLRDQLGVAQIVIDQNSPLFKKVEALKLESVITISGKVILRSKETINDKIKTGNIEVLVNDLDIISKSEVLPFQVSSDDNYNDELRLKNRFLDLRRERLKNNILLRSEIIQFIRNEMLKLDFIELQTPILTASSPEGARDYLVASRLHPGKFYALPQAPQQFKQLAMVSGFDKYFQIAPCFRDEDARADRSPGEFYQLDIEMAFCNQENIFEVVEKVIHNTFIKFSDKNISPIGFPRIPYLDALDKYGTDKPDLRNPLTMIDATEIFIHEQSNFKIFKNIINKGGIVKAIVAPVGVDKPRSFFDKLNSWAIEQGLSGLGYIYFVKNESRELTGKGPIANNLDKSLQKNLIKKLNINYGDAVFFICDKYKEAVKYGSIVINKIGTDLRLIKEDEFKFCWIIDFPMYEIDEKTNKIEFSHNPFSMPQGGMDALNEKDPLDIKAFQYDIICNGIELSSGAIRNHDIQIMLKAFNIAGYKKSDIENKFPALYNAFKYGPPPHGGIAPGIDRIVMLIANEPNIREVIMFPLNQKAEDLLMGAPNNVSKQQLKELNIDVTEEE
ncbi:MAG: aspartate--tRNA ligase [Rickettsiales bacterium]|nr:aspartate--tRNA ligase [Rickettsiales bacterium]OUV83285.1 MAG: aspartate--tRNA ligase [Rickettsiales bacterium TMED131]